MIQILLAIIVLASCATQSKPSDWIKIGSTTRDEVVDQYGEPDFIRSAASREIATYRSGPARQTSQQVEIPVAQAAGVSGGVTTRSHAIERGLGARNLGTGIRARPTKEFWVQYDENGVVRALEE
jgi:hypothetical protein